MSDERTVVADDSVAADGGENGANEATLEAVSATSDPPSDPGHAQRLLEYVTFGCGPHHLLKAIVLQFVVLFLDVGLVGYVRRGFVPGRRRLSVVMWSAASIVFVAILVVLVRQMGRRTLAPRFHEPVHLAASVCGYVVISGLFFGFGYATIVLPATEPFALTPAVILPATLISLVFASFIAIGYHAQIDATDHPHPAEIEDAVIDWLDALSWVEADPDSLAREHGYEEFVARTDDLATLLSNAKTADGSRLAADFRAWRDRFEAHSMLSRETIVRGHVGPGTLESHRLVDDHEAFVALRRRFAVIAGVPE